MKTMKLTLAAVMALAFGAACAQKVNHTETTGTEISPSPAVQIAAQRGDSIVTTLKFDKNAAKLSPEARQELAKAVTDARARGEIEDVTVVVWSDLEYPGYAKKLPVGQVKLADKRSDAVEDYLSKDLKVSTYRVDTHNMAEKPNYLSEFLKTADADLKNQLSAQGLAPEDPAFGAGRASSALVFIKLKD